LGLQSGFPTPFNARIVEIVKEVEKLHEFQAPAEIVNRFTPLMIC
jgi:hypothetical protein